MKDPKVLIACEESQRACMAFRAMGIEAYSCDIQPNQDGFLGHMEWHIYDDVLNVLNGGIFHTFDGEEHFVRKWDMIIAHPPCTFLTVAGASNIPRHPERIRLGEDAAEFFKMFLVADCDRIAIENPIPMKRFSLPQYTQLVRPWMFGESNNKPVCLWLKGLPPLHPTNIVEDRKGEMVYWIHKATGKKKSCSKWYNTDTGHHGVHRSKTFPGIAEAFASQWGKYLLELEDKDG